MTKTKTKKYVYVTKSFTFEGLQYTVRGETKEEAIIKAADLKKKLEKGEYVKQHAKARGVTEEYGEMTERTTVEEYAKMWLDTYIKPKVRAPGGAKQKHTITQKQYDSYAQKFQIYVLPEIGKMQMGKVRDYHLQRILNSAQASGLSKSTCNKIKDYVSKLFHQARVSRIIPYDPAESLIVTAEEGEARRSITDAERKIILDVAKTHRCGPWIRFLLYTGLRPAETAGLRVKHIDFDKKLIHVREAIESGTEKVLSPPKSKAGIRDVPMRDEIVSDLRAAVKGKKPSDFVFTQIGGKKMMTTTVLANNWRSFARQVDLAMGAETTAHGHIYDPHDIDKNGIPMYPDKDGSPRNGHRIAPDLTCYCLRHTFCTDLEKAGVSLKAASVIMGHEDIRITAKIYSHTDTSMIQDAGAMIDKWDQKQGQI